MKKILSLILCGVFLIGLFGCAGFSIKPTNEVISVLQASAISTVGYLISKNNPRYTDSILNWYSFFKSENGLVEIQAAFQDGMNKLSELISDDPYLQLQVRNAMNLLEIRYDGPQTDLEIGKYQAIVDSFMSGILAGKLATT